jgi:hypothetical protein
MEQRRKYMDKALFLVSQHPVATAIVAFIAGAIIF